MKQCAAEAAACETASLAAQKPWHARLVVARPESVLLLEKTIVTRIMQNICLSATGTVQSLCSKTPSRQSIMLAEPQQF